MKRIVLLFLMVSPVAAAQPDDALWQQLVGTNEARCSQQLVDGVREINRLRGEIAELQKQVAAAKGKTPER